MTTKTASPRMPRSLWAQWSPVVTSPWLIGVAVMMIVFGAKLMLIAACGSDLPFWDQWDAEGAHLYPAFLQGQLTFKDLLQPHNEHRIVFTRLLALGLLMVNGQWNAELQMVVNALLHAGVIGWLAALFARYLRGWSGRGAAAGLAIIFCLPLAWENTLAGFQSQFYFLLLFSLLHVVGTALYAPGSLRSWAAQGAGAAALFSMASGLASAAVVLAFLGLRASSRRRLERGEIALLVVNGALLGLGLWLKVDHPGHEALRVTSLVMFTGVLAQLLVWPAPWLLTLPLVLTPLILLLVLGWKQLTPLRAVLWALGGWWSLQVLLLAYGRGGGGVPDSPRYADILVFGAVVLGVAWIDAWRQARLRPPLRWSVAGLGALWLLALGLSLTSRTIDFRDRLLPVLPPIQAQREAVVRDYVAHRSPTFLDRQPWHEVPYPTTERLARLLDQPVLRRILPPSVRAALPLELDPAASHGVGPGRVPPTLPATQRPVWGSYPPEGDEPSALVTRRFSTSATAITLRVAGNGGTVQVESPVLGLPPLRLEPSDDWQEWTVRGDLRNFRLVLSAPAGRWVAVSDPVELGRVHGLVQGLLAQGRAITIAGGLLLLVLGAAAGATRPDRPSPS